MDHCCPTIILGRINWLGRDAHSHLCVHHKVSSTGIGKILAAFQWPSSGEVAIVPDSSPLDFLMMECCKPSSLYDIKFQLQIYDSNLDSRLFCGSWEQLLNYNFFEICEITCYIPMSERCHGSHRPQPLSPGPPDDGMLQALEFTWHQISTTNLWF
jgi:hypothetical protein